LCIELGLRNPETVRHFVDIFSERSSYEGIGRRLIAATVRWQLGRRRAVDSRKKTKDESRPMQHAIRSAQHESHNTEEP
jgi:hypothetical protein